MVKQNKKTQGNRKSVAKDTAPAEVSFPQKVELQLPAIPIKGEIKKENQVVASPELVA
jgi:hypothetical protein